MLALTKEAHYPVAKCFMYVISYRSCYNPLKSINMNLHVTDMQIEEGGGGALHGCICFCCALCVPMPIPVDANRRGKMWKMTPLKWGVMGLVKLQVNRVRERKGMLFTLSAKALNYLMALMWTVSGLFIFIFFLTTTLHPWTSARPKFRSNTIKQILFVQWKVFCVLAV